jgi:hypothetical protein
VSGEIHIWDVFLLLTLTSCLWQLGRVSIISEGDHAGLSENGNHGQDMNGMVILPSVGLKGVV